MDSFDTLYKYTVCSVYFSTIPTSTLFHVIYKKKKRKEIFDKLKHKKYIMLFERITK